MQKENLKLKVEQLPLFNMRGVYTEQDAKNENGEWLVLKGDGNYVVQRRFYAICEQGDNKALAVVSNIYNLVQFKDVFNPIINGINGELDGNIWHYRGSAVMDIFPTDDQYEQNGYKFGITVKNSVDKTSSLIIRFAIVKNGFRVTLPKTLQGFKKNHSQHNLLGFAQMYSGVLTKVQTQWEEIVTGFSERELTNEQELLDILTDDKFSFPDKMRKKLRTLFNVYQAQNIPYTIWTFFENCISLVSAQNYKSELHKRNHTDALVQKILEYGFLSKFTKNL